MSRTSWWHGLDVQCIQEPEPLGTGGAIRRVADTTQRMGPWLVLNGDTFFSGSVQLLQEFHEARTGAQGSLALVQVPDATRYGRVETASGTGAVVQFAEKDQIGEGSAWISAGMYILEKAVVADIAAGCKVSLEHEVFPRWVGRGLFGCKMPGERLVDIGTPEDYARAQDSFGRLRDESGTLSTVIRARAPLRIAFGGGGTDVSPYADERGGFVLNATINQYAWVSIVPNDSNRIRLFSRDLGEEAELSVGQSSERPTPRGPMLLARGVIDALGVATQAPSGFDLFTHTDCQPESGLGASSTMTVALIGAFDCWLKLGLNRYQIAQLAVKVERGDLGLVGGKQDQYAAAFGGFNFIEFSRGDVLVNPLRLPPEWTNELEYSLVLAYIGARRGAADIISEQIRNFTDQRAAHVAAMDRTKQMAVAMKHHLLKGSLGNFGSLLHDAWTAKKGMAARITSPHIDALYDAGRAAGALGGKVSGAGGGGFILFFVAPDRRSAVIQALEQAGSKVVQFGFTSSGLETWIR